MSVFRVSKVYVSKNTAQGRIFPIVREFKNNVQNILTVTMSVYNLNKSRNPRIYI